MTDEGSVQLSEDRESITQHTAVIEGDTISYRATAASWTLGSADNEPMASIFHVAYVRADVEGAAERPITFVFNGGPGVSSALLHLGLLGPRRARVSDPLASSISAWELSANEYSLLERTDLVFIDPVNTGFSRTLIADDPHRFHGVLEDVELIGRFIELYISRHGRWQSPKFIAGESYGTTRAAALTAYLQESRHIQIAGVVLISADLQFITNQPDPGNDLPYVLSLPSYAAVATYHGRRDSRENDLTTLTRKVEEFALDAYAATLLQGSRASRRSRQAVAAMVADLCGLPVKVVERANLRISPLVLQTQLLADQQRTIGMLDGRFSGINPSLNDSHGYYDPSREGVILLFNSAINRYVRDELGYQSDEPYETHNPSGVQPWNWEYVPSPWSHGHRYLDVASSLRGAMSRNRHLRVFQAGGYYDLVTPYFAAEWVIDHLALDHALTGNVTIRRYESGHFPYIDDVTTGKICSDLRDFYDDALRVEARPKDAGVESDHADSRVGQGATSSRAVARPHRTRRLGSTVRYVRQRLRAWHGCTARSLLPSLSIQRLHVLPSQPQASRTFR